MLQAREEFLHWVTTVYGHNLADKHSGLKRKIRDILRRQSDVLDLEWQKAWR